MKPNEGYLVIGRSENYNHGPLSMTCLDLSTGEIVYNLPSNSKPEFKSGSETDAATIAIMYAICYARRNGVKPLIYTSNRNAKIRFSKIAVDKHETFGDAIYSATWNPLIAKGAKAVKTFDDVEIKIWDKDSYGENPLKTRYFKV